MKFRWVDKYAGRTSKLLFSSAGTSYREASTIITSSCCVTSTWLAPFHVDDKGASRRLYILDIYIHAYIYIRMYRYIHTYVCTYLLSIGRTHRISTGTRGTSFKVRTCHDEPTLYAEIPLNCKRPFSKEGASKTRAWYGLSTLTTLALNELASTINSIQKSSLFFYFFFLFLIKTIIHKSK